MFVKKKQIYIYIYMIEKEGRLGDPQTIPGHPMIPSGCLGISWGAPGWGPAGGYGGGGGTILPDACGEIASRAGSRVTDFRPVKHSRGPRRPGEPRRRPHGSGDVVQRQTDGQGLRRRQKMSEEDRSSTSRRLGTLVPSVWAQPLEILRG